MPQGLRSKSVEPSLAKEASVTRELFKEREFTPAREEVRRPSIREESAPAAPTSRRSNNSKRYGSSASSRFSKATASLYQKSRGALGVLRSSSLFDLRGSTTDLRGSTTDLRNSTSDLRGSIRDLRGSTTDLRGSMKDLRGSTTDLRGSMTDLRCSTHDWRSSTSDLRGSMSDLNQATPQSRRLRRQTSQVSELDLSKARMWEGASRRESESRELASATR